LDYRQRLKPTAAGWPVRSIWCVWIEPLEAAAPGGLFEARWQRAVQAALATWKGELPIQQVASPDQAQVRLWRRKPPLEGGPDGAMRASHGRALLGLRQVQRLGQWQLEPLVEVLISPGQRPEAIQATSLHELGHAFGLWGHSDQAGDVMAVSPTAQPVLTLSARDRATLRWLLQQPRLSP
jgi:predicted Zn-dependent protease